MIMRNTPTLHDIGILAFEAETIRKSIATRRCELRERPEPDVGFDGTPRCLARARIEHFPMGEWCEPCLIRVGEEADLRRLTRKMRRWIERRLLVS